MTPQQKGHLYSYLRQQHAGMVDACRQVGVLERDEVVLPPTDAQLDDWLDDLQRNALVRDAGPA